MKQTLTFNVSVLSSTASKMDIESFDKSIDCFDGKNYQQSVYYLLDYINPELRKKYGNSEGTDFKIPHGSIVVSIKLDNEKISISAPFVEVPDKDKIPLLRQVAELNMNVMDLASISLKDNKLYFGFDCPLYLAHPAKLYDVLYDICGTGDKYDDEFVTKFGVKRIYEPIVTPYSPETLDNIYKEIQLSCKECLDAVKEFDTLRKYGYSWNVIASTLLKILYFSHPQGQLLNDLDDAVTEHDREDIPLPEIVSRGREEILKIQAMSKEELAESLYFVETFVPNKRRSNLKNIQDNFEQTYNNASSAYEAGDVLACSLMITYKFYELYYYNNVQDDVNAIVVKALTSSSAKPFEVAAPILYKAMEKIMEGELGTPNTKKGFGKLISSLFGN